MSEIKLKECPFCGSDRLYITERNYFGENYCTISCIECHISQTGNEFETKEDAIEQWNTRNPMDRIVERLEELADNSNNHMYESYFDGKEDGIREAIEIVKVGGTDES